MQREAVSGHMTRHNAGSEVLYPPGNQTVFRGTERVERLRMWEYLRNVSSCPQWRCENIFYCNDDDHVCVCGCVCVYVFVVVCV